MKVINGKNGLIEHDLLTLEEMNNSPFPYYDEKIYDKYFDGNPIPMNQLSPQAHILTSRGCPFKCIFCVWPATMTGNDPDGENKRTVRQYSADYIKGFLDKLTSDYKFEACNVRCR